MANRLAIIQNENALLITSYAEIRYLITEL